MITKLAVIPARGGSTRLKDKNIYPLAGKPLIHYTVEAVIQSESFDRIVVSTDSQKIADAVSQFKDIEIVKRPAKYASATVTVLEALLALMEEYEKYDIFAYFLPTCPLRNADDIRGALKLLQPDVDSVVSVCRCSDPLQLTLIKKNDDIIPVFDNLTTGMTNSRYYTKYYRPNGGFYMSWWDKLLEGRNFFIGNVKGYELAKDRAIDIDSLPDIIYAEAILDYYSKNKTSRRNPL